MAPQMRSQDSRLGMGVLKSFEYGDWDNTVCKTQLLLYSDGNVGQSFRRWSTGKVVEKMF